jgi:hypothetical protein
VGEAVGWIVVGEDVATGLGWEFDFDFSVVVDGETVVGDGFLLLVGEGGDCAEVVVVFFFVDGDTDGAGVI